MDGPSSQAQPRGGRPNGWSRVWAPLLLIASGILIYLNSFQGVFLFDDTAFILENERMRRLWPIWEVVRNSFGRHVVDYSLAVNYAISGSDPWSYHAFNLLVHLLAALTLFGIVRRTLLSEQFALRYRSSAVSLATVAALIWLVHPLQTESVTYTHQRAESMMGLFYLATLYSVIRGARSSRSRRWYLLSVVCCALGMGCKAVMASAPLMVALYDRIFIARSFRGLVRRRWALYLGLAITWLGVAGVMRLVFFPQAQAVGSTVGLAYSAVTPLAHAATQPGVLLHYLLLAFWPQPLCLDYGWPLASRAAQIVPAALIVGLLVVSSCFALWIRPWLGFTALWFFVILAPTSSVIPIQDQAVEHRTYLPMASVVVLAVVGGQAALAALCRRSAWGRPIRRGIAIALTAAIVLGLGLRTVRRNRDYHSHFAMWSDAVVMRPHHARVHYNLGLTFEGMGRLDEAMGEYRTATRIRPHARAHNNLAIALKSLGRLDEAISEYRRALEIAPSASTNYNLGLALESTGQTEQAVAAYQKAVAIKPHASAHNNLGLIYASQGRIDDAIAEYRTAMRIRPHASSQFNLGLVLQNLGRLEEAVAAYREAARINPAFAQAHYRLGTALETRGALSEAFTAYKKALEIAPNLRSARSALDRLSQAKSVQSPS